MFVVSEEERSAIRQAFEAGGEWAAVAELRRYFPLQRNEDALSAVRAIVRWPSEASLSNRNTRRKSDPPSPRANARHEPTAPETTMIDPAKTLGRNADRVGSWQWTPATYEAVAVDPAGGEGVITIMLSGEVCGAFGVDQRVADDQAAIWVITHLLTGQRLPREFLTREAATACVEKLQGLRCWNSGDAAAMLSHPDTQFAQRILLAAPDSRET
ncbi:hypothetical protein SAMN02982917_6905 [Azospirillum oryzae]|uniref:Uncharacterized protein n=1 Tax=Azospirillum oryzae TaxID=286727 RepID=A0A1X7HNG4_9PROT|nr:hypothetical protein [Azospirillum oryzae]SMF89945.1 hypothetical protein SAMN02982917_6905 [Azospirillum oryzae]